MFMSEEEISSSPQGSKEEIYIPYHITQLDRYRGEIEHLYAVIEDYSKKLGGLSPEVYERCMRLLEKSGIEIANCTKFKDFILSDSESEECQIRFIKIGGFISDVKFELNKNKANRNSFIIVVIITYIFAIIIYTAYHSGYINWTTNAEDWNKMPVLGIPQPVWIWAIIGSLTSMLLRSGQNPFSDFNEALRWLLFRPIVGVIMGVMTYLMLTTGLIVFVGPTEAATPQTPQLIWVIAFLGSFSDTLSINLLESILGKFPTKEEKKIETEGNQISPTNLQQHRTDVDEKLAKIEEDEKKRIAEIAELKANEK
jgi:hypothetical protein